MKKKSATKKHSPWAIVKKVLLWMFIGHVGIVQILGEGDGMRGVQADDTDLQLGRIGGGELRGERHGKQGGKEGETGHGKLQM